MQTAVIRKIKTDGEITAEIKKTIIGKATIADSQFQLELGEIHPDLLTRWDSAYYDSDKLQCSEAELMIAYPVFYLKGTYIDLYGIAQPLSEGISIDEAGKGYYDRYDYVYADRDAVLQGAFEGNDGYTNGLAYIYGASVKKVFSVSLKKGWNKLKYSITYNGKYIIQKIESSSESGFFKIFVSW